MRLLLACHEVLELIAQMSRDINTHQTDLTLQVWRVFLLASQAWGHASCLLAGTHVSLFCLGA